VSGGVALDTDRAAVCPTVQEVCGRWTGAGTQAGPVGHAWLLLAGGVRTGCASGLIGGELSSGWEVVA
jgi:hypothetical protein